MARHRSRQNRGMIPIEVQVVWAMSAKTKWNQPTLSGRQQRVVRQIAYRQTMPVAFQRVRARCQPECPRMPSQRTFAIRDHRGKLAIHIQGQNEGKAQHACRCILYRRQVRDDHATASGKVSLTSTASSRIQRFRGQRDRPTSRNARSTRGRSHRSSCDR